MGESDGGIANVYTLSSKRSREKPKRKLKKNDYKSSIKSAKEKNQRLNCPRTEPERVRKKFRFEANNKTIGNTPYSERQEKHNGVLHLAITLKSTNKATKYFMESCGTRVLMCRNKNLCMPQGLACM